jgi:hypothetical protein
MDPVPKKKTFTKLKNVFLSLLKILPNRRQIE